ncbi:MAG TPA: efflux RND transporter periplasmic adaptor subunit [Candidatus Paceibacterota bacterium]|nr:efflux RND transporter periplasmic adaptor subunit [Candidatus Paceibacterota bacterium]
MRELDRAHFLCYYSGLILDIDMTVIQSVRNFISYKYTKPALAVLLVFVLALYIRSENTPEVQEPTENPKPLVSLITAASYVDDSTLSLIGNVRAFSEAQITAEVGGLVTAVNATLGQFVNAGSIIATIENAAARAALLQAEGAYEAAEAAAVSSNLGTEEAKIRLLNSFTTLTAAYNSARGTYQNVLFSVVDENYSNPNGYYPGLRISTLAPSSFLRAERVSFQSVLTEWRALDTSARDISLQNENLKFVIEQLNRLMNVVDIFTAAVNSANNINNFTNEQIQQYNQNLTGARSQLVAAQNNVESAFTNVETAQKSYERAQTSSVGGNASAASASLKQALGSLQAAQANLAKTILRSPISGTVNSLSVKAGDYIGPSQTVAVVANNSALEIITYVGDAERETLNIGDSVLLEGEYEGVITQISPAIDRLTKKTEVRIATDNEAIKNGSTVKITRPTDTVSELKEILVPLTAVKFALTDGSVFIIEDDILISRPVTLGRVRGNSVVVLTGLSATEEFVIDARGLLAGQEVEVKN